MAESMRGLHRTARCGELGEEYIGKTVCMMGWVQKSRNKGGLIFTDLRDRSGILQILFEENECGAEVFEKASKLRAEFVIAVEGCQCQPCYRSCGAGSKKLENPGRGGDSALPH